MAPFGVVLVPVKGLVDGELAGVLMAVVPGLDWEEPGTAAERGAASGASVILFAGASIFDFSLGCQ